MSKEQKIITKDKIMETVFEASCKAERLWHNASNCVDENDGGDSDDNMQSLNNCLYMLGTCVDVLQIISRELTDLYDGLECGEVSV